MTDEERQEIDARLDRMEKLVNRALCKCVYGPYWKAHNNCPVHAFPGLTITSTTKEVHSG